MGGRGWGGRGGWCSVNLWRSGRVWGRKGEGRGRVRRGRISVLVNVGKFACKAFIEHQGSGGGSDYPEWEVKNRWVPLRVRCWVWGSPCCSSGRHRRRTPPSPGNSVLGSRLNEMHATGTGKWPGLVTRNGIQPPTGTHSGVRRNAEENPTPSLGSQHKLRRGR